MSATPQLAATPATRRSATLALVGAIAFPAFYLTEGPLHDAVVVGERPMPTATTGEVYQYIVDNPTALAVTGAVQLASVIGLVISVVNTRRTLRPDSGDSRYLWGHRAGLLAFASMALCSLLLFVAAATGSSLTPQTAALMQKASFIAGGLAHVLALGAYVWLTRTSYPGKALRVFGVIAAVPPVLAISSLVVWQAAALILLGRLLCMIWVVWAAVALFRARSRAGLVAR